MVCAVVILQIPLLRVLSFAQTEYDELQIAALQVSSDGFPVLQGKQQSTLL